MQDEYVKLEKGTVQVTRTGYGPTPWCYCPASAPCSRGWSTAPWALNWPKSFPF